MTEEELATIITKIDSKHKIEYPDVLIEFENDDVFVVHKEDNYATRVAVNYPDTLPYYGEKVQFVKLLERLTVIKNINNKHHPVRVEVGIAIEANYNEKCKNDDVGRIEQEMKNILPEEIYNKLCEAGFKIIKDIE